MDFEKGSLLSAQNIKKSFKKGKGSVEVLKGLDFMINSGELVCIIGASGAGKSTFLHILGTLDHPTEGSLFFKETNLLEKSDSFLAQFRNEKMGFVFQFHHLFHEFTALENIQIPAQIAGKNRKDIQQKSEELVNFLGLYERRHHYPSELSGGEQQRVSIARALIQDPEILFADEPTGNLDTENGRKIENLFFQLKEERNLTLIVVTHNKAFAQKFPKILEMENGIWV